MIAGPTETVLKQVLMRDDNKCAKCGKQISGERGRDWSLHHRRPRGAGGTSLVWPNLPGNLILLHGSGVDGCHGDVESYRDDAREKGFLVALNGKRKSSAVPILHAVHGWVLLDDHGGITLQEIPF